MPDTKWVSKQNLQTFWEYIKDQIEEIVSHAAVGVETTWDEYEELPEEEKMNGTIYYITDKDNEDLLLASDATYDNTQSGLTATDAQGAIDELVESTIPNLTKDCLQYKGVVTTNNADYLVDSGIHYNDTSLQYNVPSFSVNYSHIVVFNYGGVITQVAINAGLNIAFRKRSGSPATWSSWINVK